MGCAGSALTLPLGGPAALIRYVAKGLSAEAAKTALAYADLIESPRVPLPAWPMTARSQAVVAQDLAGWPGAIRTRAGDGLQVAGRRLGADGRGQVAYQVALWTVASYCRDRRSAWPRYSGGLRRKIA